MPRVPSDYDLSQVEVAPLRAPRMQVPDTPNPLQILGGGLRSAGEDFRQMGAKQAAEEDAYNKTEGARIAAKTVEEATAVIELNNREIQEPAEFEEKTSEALRGLYGAIPTPTPGRRNGPGGGDSIGGYAQRSLEVHTGRLNRHVEALKFGKQKDRSRRNIEDSFKTYSDLAINTNGEQDAGAARFSFEDLITDQQARGFISAEQGGEFLRNFGERIRQGRGIRFKTGLLSELDDLVNSGTTGGEPVGELLKQGHAKIDAFSDMPIGEREQLKSKFTDQLWTGNIEAQIEAHPYKTRDQLKAGAFNKLIDQQSLRLLKDKAETEIDRIERRAEAVRKEQERRVGKEVNDFKSAVMNGFQWSGNVARLQWAVKGTEHELEFMETVRDSAELSTFGQMGPLQQEQYLRAKSQQRMSGTEATLYKKLETAHNQTKEALGNDALTYAIRQRVIPPVSPFNLNNPNSLKERSLAAGIVSQRYGVTASPISDDEADALSQTLSKSTADGQVKMFRQLRSGLEDSQVKAVAAQLAKKKDDPVLVQAMGLSLEAPEAASRILRGREILRDNKEVGLKGADLKTAQDKIASTLGEAYNKNPAHYSAVADSALSIYAFKSWQDRDLSGVVNTIRLEQAIKEASGGVLQLGRFGSRYSVQAPRYGADEADFMDLLKRADYSQAKGMKADDIQRHGVFESIGDGRYLVKVGPGYVQGDRGPFVLDLNLPSRRAASAAAGATLGGVAGMVR